MNDVLKDSGCVQSQVMINMYERNYVPITVNGVCLSVLVDSGADENTISVGMLRYLYGSEKLPNVAPSKYKNVVLADGQKRIRVLGKMFLQIFIQGTSFHTNFHIKETDVRSIIIGNFFLRQNTAVLDFAKSLLLLKPECNVKANETVRIPVGVKFHMMGIVESIVLDVSEGFVTMRYELKRNEGRIVVVDSISRVKEGMVHLCVVNVSDDDVKIVKGDIVGKFVINDVEPKETLRVNEQRLWWTNENDGPPMHDLENLNAPLRRNF